MIFKPNTGKTLNRISSGISAANAAGMMLTSEKAMEHVDNATAAVQERMKKDRDSAELNSLSEFWALCGRGM